MKEKRTRMYLIYWFSKPADEKYRSFPSYGITKSGDEFIRLSYVEHFDKKNVDFDEIVGEFLEKCKTDDVLIRELLAINGGIFNIEIVPEFSRSAPPAISINCEMIKFINSLGNKFGYLEIDSYVI